MIVWAGGADCLAANKHRRRKRSATRTVARGLLSTLQCFQDSDRTNSGKSGYVPVINLLVIEMPPASATTSVSEREAL